MEKIILMSDIYVELEQKLKELEPKMAILKEQYESYLNLAEKAEEEMIVVQGNMNALAKAIAALQAVDMPPTEEEVKIAEKAKDEEKKKENLVWKHKKAYCIKYASDGKEICRKPSQNAMAREIGWDQSSLSRFMRFTKTQQVAKKGYYFGWEY